MDIKLSFIGMDAYLVMLIRLVVAAVLGALIGIERSNSKHDAGLRTHIIVCLGSTAVMITSELIAVNYGNITDITRLGAQVISGIGFLGAGSIIVSRSRVRGLTTAAGLWTTACLGLVIGAGFIEIAVTIVALMMFTIYVLKPLSLKINSGEATFEISVSLTEKKVTEFVDELVSQKFEIASVKTKGDKAVITVHADIKSDKNVVFASLLKIDGVIGVSET